jgi:CheY-like chemotaxis protein
VEEAGGGRSALALLEKISPSLILLDLLLADMDGMEFLDALSKRQEWSLIPVVVTTSEDLGPEYFQKLSGQVEGVLRKGSYRCEELVSQLRVLATRKPESPTDPAAAG